jgi:hypothetical protein
MASFEEWWATQTMYARSSYQYEQLARDTWDAATTAANTRAGDASNEAEKDARRKVAIQRIHMEAMERDGNLDEFLADAIIKEAQG